MTRSSLVRSTFVVLALVFVSALGALGQSTPWPFAAKPASTGRSVTVAFWNIQWFPGSRPDASHDEEARQIAAVHADMAKLNGVDVIGMEEVRGFEQAGVAVKPLAGFKVDVCASWPPREGQNEPQEVAIASRLPAMSAWYELWKENGPVVPPRGFSFAAYQVAPGQLLLVYAVHLKSNNGEMRENMSMREESMQQLQAHMQAMETAYGKLGKIAWVIGGDFNTSMEDPQFTSEKTLRGLSGNGFAWSWKNMPPSSRVTLPPAKSFPPACFDHIFCKGAKIRKAWVVNTSNQSSDHRPVMAVLDF